MSVPFNPAQVATYDDARQLAAWLNAQPQFAGCQILPGDDQNGVVMTLNANMPWLPPTPQKPGIYVPKWEAGPAANQVPQIGGATYLHFRMKNGFEGANVGLIVDKFKRYPTAQEYVLVSLAREYGGIQ